MAASRWSGWNIVLPALAWMVVLALLPWWLGLPLLFALVAGMAGSLLLGFIPGLGVMLLVHLVIDVLFAGYLALLLRMRNVAAERDMKLTFLPSNAVAPAPAPYGSFVGPPPEGYGQVAAGYGQVVAGYGSLLARQSAH